MIAMAIGSVVRAQTTDLPREWVDPDTGHRIVRLSDEAGSSSFYFHQYAYTAGGDKLIFSTRGGLSTYNFKTKKIEQIVEGRTGGVIVGRKTRTDFYTKGDSIYETDVDSKATRLIVKAAQIHGGAGLAVIADETLLGGSTVVGEMSGQFAPTPRSPRGTAAPRAFRIETRRAHCLARDPVSG